jgi:hypothetical protein
MWREEKTKSKVSQLHNDLIFLWTTIRKAKGYKEWINADVSCYLVAVQMKFVVDQILIITQQNNPILPSQDSNLDLLYINMSTLCDEMLHNAKFDNVNYANLLYEQNILYHKLNRILYIVK